MPNCIHEKYLPSVNENTLPPLDDSWNLMQWEGKTIKVNMCKKCKLLYWEDKR